MAAVLMVTTGATLFQGANSSRSGMIPRALFRNPAVIAPEKETGCVIISGTDSLEELAFALSLWISAYIEKEGGPVVVLKGAMKLSDQLSFDGAGNAADSLRVLGSKNSHSVRGHERGDTLSTIREKMIPNVSEYSNPNLVRLDTFGVDGPWYYHPLDSSLVAPCVGLTIPRIPTPQFHSVLSNVHNPFGRFNVPLFTISFPVLDPPSSSTPLPHGIVIACPGTCSLPTAWLEALSPAWTSRIPVVIVSRCATGGTMMMFHAKFSKEKYISNGFLLDEYEGLNPMQARLLLMFRLAIAETARYNSKL
ncbi:Asparaginase/glutaminase [Cladochytrium replicatum]|nr:Asparaginase/glutaminase [Cladochytrium replicatum]